MKPARFILLASEDSWQIGIVDEHGDRLLETDEGNLQSTLIELGYAGDGVVLAVPSAWCLRAEISIEHIPRRDRRQAMAYRLEDELPLPAEDFVADFIPLTDLRELGVCVLIEPLQQSIASLESKGIFVEIVCPQAILAVQDLLASTQNLTEGVVSVLLWDHDLVRVSDGRPRAWSTVDSQTLSTYLRIEAATAAPLRLVCVCGDMDRVGRFVEPFDYDTISPDTHCIRGGAALLDGGLQPWAEFRRRMPEARAVPRALRRPMRFSVAAAMAFSLVCTIGSLWRAAGYNALAVENHHRLEQVYQAAFPREEVPPGIRSRLVSTEHRLRGLTGDSTSLPRRTSALTVLYRVLSNLPTDTRYRLLDIRLEDDGIALAGETLSHGDADAITAALRREPSFSFDPPRTQQLADAQVSVSLSGSVHANGGRP